MQIARKMVIRPEARVKNKKELDLGQWEIH
jgi:hypothetical protein